MQCTKQVLPGKPALFQPFTSLLAFLLGLAAIVTFSLPAQAQVTTYHNDNARTGQNLSEFYLSPSSVNATAFGKLFSQPVDGYIYAQPLYVPGVTIPEKGVHNVVYVVTEHDGVYAFDADSNTGANSQPLWQLSLINPANGVTTVNMHALLACDDILPEVGITGTPVIDTGSSTMYLVAKTSENGTIVQRLHALDLATGGEKFGGPIVIQAQVPGTGVGSVQGLLTFDTLRQNQRAGLLLQNGLLYVAWGSHCDAPPHHGWIIAYDPGSLGQVALWNASPNSWGGGIWQGGGGLAADSTNVYFATGNGKYALNAGGSDAGDSIVKLSAPAGATFRIADYFTPSDQSVLARFNRDLGSGGVLLLPDQPPASAHQHLLVTGGKEGTLYVIDRDNMGQFSANANQDVQTLAGITTSIFNTPAWWNNNVYLGAGGKPLEALGFNSTFGTLTATPTSVSSNVFQGRSGTPSISANGNTNAIVWALDNGGSGVNKSAILYAYDALNLGSLLYSSKQNVTRDSLGPAVKFSLPTITNGKVYVATQNQLNVLGLMPALSLVTGGGQTAIAGSTLPVALQVKATNPYSGAPISGATITFDDGAANGTLSNPAPVTSAAGLVSTNYTLPKKAQTVTITVNAPGFTSLSLTETATPGPAFQAVVGGGNNQTGPVSTPLPTALAVKVRDQNANGVPGVQVSFTDGGAGGSFSPSQAATDATGYVRTTYTTPPNTGLVKVLGSAAGVKNAAILNVTVQ